MTITVSPRAKEITVPLLSLSNVAGEGQWVDIRGQHYKSVQVHVSAGASGVNVDIEISNDLATASPPTNTDAMGISASKFVGIDDACVGIRARLNVVATGNITDATADDPVVVTSAGHGLSNGNRVKISGVVGMVELNGNIYTVANVATDTFELSGVDGTTFTAYVSGGVWEKQPTGTVSVILHGILES